MRASCSKGMRVYCIFHSINGPCHHASILYIRTIIIYIDHYAHTCKSVGTAMVACGPSARQHVPLFLSQATSRARSVPRMLMLWNQQSAPVRSRPSVQYGIIRSVLSAITTTTAAVHTLRPHHYQRPSLHTHPSAAPSCPARRYRATLGSACKICHRHHRHTVCPMTTDTYMCTLLTYAQSTGPYVSTSVSIATTHVRSCSTPHIETRPRITSLMRPVSNLFQTRCMTLARDF